MSKTGKAIKIDYGDTPWEAACKIINARHDGKSFLGADTEYPFFDNEDLRKLGEHLVNYVRTEATDGKT